MTGVGHDVLSVHGDLIDPDRGVVEQITVVQLFLLLLCPFYTPVGDVAGDLEGRHDPLVRPEHRDPPDDKGSLGTAAWHLPLDRPSRENRLRDGAVLTGGFEPVLYIKTAAPDDLLAAQPQGSLHGGVNPQVSHLRIKQGDLLAGGVQKRFQGSNMVYKFPKGIGSLNHQRLPPILRMSLFYSLRQRKKRFAW